MHLRSPYRPRKLSVSLAVAALVATSATFSLNSSIALADSPLSLTVTPSPATVGDTITISGVDCDATGIPGAAGPFDAYVQLDSPSESDVTDDDVTPAANGTWSAQLTVPADTAGNYTVEASCYNFESGNEDQYDYNNYALTVEPVATPTPAPTDVPTPTATPAPTDAPTPTVTPAPTDMPTPGPVPTDTPTPAPTDAPTPTVSPVATATPTASPAPTATPVATATPTPVVTSTPAVSPTPTPTTSPVATATPAPTATPIPSATPEPTPTADQSIHIGDCPSCNTVSTAPGSTITISATGYDPNETVTFVLHSDPVTLGTAVADATGAVTNATFTIPAGTATGNHVVIATGNTSGTAKVVGVTLAAATSAAATTDPSTTSATGDLASTGYNSGMWLSEAVALLAIGAIAVTFAARRRRLFGADPSRGDHV